MNDSHLSAEQVLLLVDRRLGKEEEHAARVHIARCADCSRALRQGEQFEKSVRTAPLERAPSEFTSRVMASLPPRMYAPYASRLLGFLAPTLGVVLVLSAIGLALSVGAKPASSSGDTWFSAVRDVVHRAELQVGTIAQGAVDTIVRYAPFLGDKSAFAMSVLSLAVVAGLATFDRIVLRKFAGRL
jgi:anti-sigma factor RsiW